MSLELASQIAGLETQLRAHIVERYLVSRKYDLPERWAIFRAAYPHLSLDFKQAESRLKAEGVTLKER